MAEYKSNSHKSREERHNAAHPAPKQVVSAPATIRQKNLLVQIAEGLMADGAEELKRNIVSDVLIPHVKKAILDSVTIFLYPNGAPDRGSVPRVSYRGYYDRYDQAKADYRDDRTDYGRRREFQFNWNDIVLRSRGDAEYVLASLDDIIADYGVVSVADLYDLVGISDKPYTANYFGWTNTRGAVTVPLADRDGYLLKMPRPKQID